MSRKTSTPTTAVRLSTGTIVRRVWGTYMIRYLGQVGIGVLSMILVAAATAAITQVVQPIIDDVFVAKDETRLFGVTMAIVGIFVVLAVATYGQHYAVRAVGVMVSRDIQRDLYDRMIRADLKYFHASTVGQSISRFLNDAQIMRDAMATTVVALCKDMLTLVFLIGAMFWADWRMTLVAMVVLPLVALPIARIGRLSRKSSERTQVASGDLSSFLADTLYSVRQVKAYGREDYESGRAGTVIGKWQKAFLRNLQARALISPITELIAGTAVAAVVWFGGKLVIDGHMTPGTFTGFLTALLFTVQPMRRLGKLHAAFQSGVAAADRLLRAMKDLPEIEDRSQGRTLKVSKGHVRFDNVRFHYPDGTEALKGINLECLPGRTIALVGGSGGGKSTVLNLIARFYDATSGDVTIDGQRVDSVSVASLRAAMGFVGQDTALFDDTVRANILYGRPEASEAEVVEAAKAANADGFIRHLPNGYDTVVGSAGFRLSGGQRQRIAIARAMLRDAPILLLDEATSALDTESERKVQAALNRLARGRSTVMVAHRLSTVINADRIYVIEDGRVVESGSHAELMARGGRYAGLYTDSVPDLPQAAVGAE
ncbi:MAG: ABC transporter ATP-binding protein [Pseudomonadota bacterium]|nr:ABC transporter ATP-binding protein [Pseudomonadota bacterium]